MAELLTKAKDQVVEALSQATAAVSLGAPSGKSLPSSSSTPTSTPASPRAQTAS